MEQARIKVITGAVEDIISLMERLFYNETVEEAKKVLRKELLSWILEELSRRQEIRKVFNFAKLANFFM